MKLIQQEKREIIQWLSTKYDDKMTMFDYCYSIYYEILDYCSKHNMILLSKEDIFLGHLISILYKTYTLR
jgi:hypothetical protein